MGAPPKVANPNREPPRREPPRRAPENRAPDRSPPPREARPQAPRAPERAPEPPRDARPDRTPSRPQQPPERQARPERPASSDDPWARMQHGLRRIGGEADRLAEGRARLDGTTLVVQIRAGRALAEARSAIENRGVQSLLKQLYGPGATLVAEALPGTGSAAEQQKALMRQVAADPRIQKVLTRLDGELQHVARKRPPKPPEEPEES